MNYELKFRDFFVTHDPVSITGNLTPSICLFKQGDGESNRVGRRVVLRQIGCRYSFQLKPNHGTALPRGGDCVRFIVYWDKQANGAQALPGEILEQQTIADFYNLSNEDRFIILMDKLHNINYGGLGAFSDGLAPLIWQALVVQNFTWQTLVNIPVEFDNIAGVITEITSNNVGVLLISESAQTTFQAIFRTRFSD